METCGKRKQPIRGKLNHAAVSSIASLLLTVTAAVLVFALCGCQKARKVFKGEQTAKATHISKEKLRQELEAFEDYAAATFRQAGSELDELVPELRTRRTNLIMRTRLGQAFRTMIGQEDPVVAFIETWGLCARVTYYFEHGEGSALYKDHQALAIDTFRQIERRIEGLGREFLDEELFEETRINVHQFARARPIKATFSNLVVYAVETKPGEPGAFSKVVGIPMAPFSAMKGVDRTASAIYGVRTSVDRFTDVVEEWPEAVQWQMLLLLIEMEETEIVKSLLSSMTKVSDSSVQLAATAEKLPEEIRQQASILIEEIDAKQENLQATLDKTEKTALAIDQTAKSIKEVAVGVEAAAKATGDAMKEWKTMPRKEKKDDEPKTKVTDYGDVAREVTAAANEVRGATAEIRELIESGALPGRIEDVNSRVIGAVNRTAVQVQSLTNHITWRIIQLLLLVFVLALAYRIITGKLLPKPS
jgi:hypothetical protein